MTSSPYSAAAANVTILSAPIYGASLPVAVKRFFTKYATFSGRASRSEYWWWTLVSVSVVVVLEIVALVAGSAGSTIVDGSSVPGPGFIPVAILIVVFGLGIIVPTYALIARRLHDANFSALLILIMFVPFVGGLALFVLTLLPSNPLGARFDL